MSNLLLSDTTGKWNLTGEPVRADGFYGSSDGHHTISLQVHEFIGRIHLEASVVEKPTDSDWFPVSIPTYGAYIQYPRGSSGNGKETSTIGFNVHVNATWFRIRLDRTYLNLTVLPENLANFGTVGKILLSR